MPGERCDDGIDNDGDDRTDCADTDCASAPACAPCGTGPTFPAIDCRLGGLIDRIETEPNIQTERARLVVFLTASRQAEQAAATACAASDLRGARRRLKESVKRLQKYVRRLGGGSARRTIPAVLRTELQDAGDALRSDAKTLRATLVCPADATAAGVTGPR